MEEYIIDDEYKYKFNKKTNSWDIYQNNSLLPKTVKKLFKFYSLNLYNIEALLNHYFYLSNPSDFNDPFDCNINLVSGISTPESFKSVKRNIYKNVGIVSFSETINNHLMWAHYTNNYNGYALEFEGDNIQIDLNKEIIEKKTLTRVIYPKNPPRIPNTFPFAQHYVFTTKLEHWSYEREWRIITKLTEEERELKFVPESLKGIYIGHKIPDNNKSGYKLILETLEIRFPNIPVYVVYPHPTDLKLEFEKVWN